MYKVLDKEYDFVGLVDAWISDSKNVDLTKALKEIYQEKDKGFVFELLYRLTLTPNKDILNLTKYVDAWSYSINLGENRETYLKILYSCCIINNLFNHNYYIIKLHQDKFESLPKSKSPQTVLSIEPPTTGVIQMLSGYEKLWNKKATKLYEKAEKLNNKKKNPKAIKLLEENIKKYGDTRSLELLAFIHRENGNEELALSYFEQASVYGQIKSHYIINNHKHEKECNKYLTQADNSANDKERLENLINAFKYKQYPHNEITLNIVRLLLTSPTVYDVDLAKKYLDYYFSYMQVDSNSNKNDEFFALYTKALIELKDYQLAYLCACCVKEKSEELKDTYYSLQKTELDRTYKLIKNRLLEDTAKERKEKEETIALAKQQKVQEEQNCQEKEHLKEEQLSLTNIFNLDPDFKDFTPKRFIESYENYNKKLDYYKKALESDIEIEIVKNLEKAGKLMHTKAMVALYHYYTQKDNLDKAYKWLFEALNFIEYLDIKNKVSKNAPVSLPHLLKYQNKNQDDYKCREFIEDKFDFSSDLSEDIIKELEKHSKNFFVKTCLYEYYSTHDEDKALDLLYDLASMNVDYDDKLKYIMLLIDQMGGLDAKLNERFVNFLVNSNTQTTDKYILYHRARIYSNKNLCEKYNLTYSLSKTFNLLKKASESKRPYIKGLGEKVDIWLASCYENAIGTYIDLEKAQELYSGYNVGTGGKLMLFNQFAFKEIYDLKNFMKIKEHFLNDIKIEDYKSTFETIKKFFDLGFTQDDVFDSDGKYIGDKNYYKVIEKEQELERKRQEEIERKRQEELRREQERIRQEQERIRQEQLRKEEEARLEAEKIRKEQELKNRELQNKNTTSSTSKNQSTTSTTSTTSTLKGTTSEKTALQLVREKYNRPIEPVRPDKDYNDGLTYKQRVRQYGSDYKYMMKAYDEKVENYSTLMSDYRKRLIKAMEDNNIFENLPSVYNASKDNCLLGEEFYYKCYETLKNRFGSYIDLDINMKLDYSAIVKNTDIYYFERNLAGIPCYMDNMYININFGHSAFDIECYGRSESYTYFDTMEKFNNSELSKFMTWGEFSSTTNEIGVVINQNYNDEKLNAYMQGKRYIKNEIWQIVLRLFKSHTVIYSRDCFYGGQCYVAPKNIKINFKFPSAYD